MADARSSFDVLIQDLRAGDSLAEARFWQRYGPLLEHLAEKHLGGRLLRRCGPDDVALSACRTFLRRAQRGEFELPDAASLWRLLCAITLTKAREQARFHRRKRRSIDREVAPPSSPEDETPGDFEAVDREPTPAEANAFAEQFQQLIANLQPDERQVVEMKLQDRSNADIAQAMQSSERTVRRILARLREQFEQALSDRASP